jgi:putative heme-binding domain-containing protein
MKHSCLFIIICVASFSGLSSADEPRISTANGPKKTPAARVRVPWTTSRIKGSPEPPLPYKFENAFPKLVFKNPLLLTQFPGAKRFVIGENGAKLYSFVQKSDVAKADLFLDLTKEIHSWDPAGKVSGVGSVYGLAFHPHFADNRLCYICYVVDSKTGAQLPDGSRVSRFRVTDTDPPRCDPKSEQILITWQAGGHNGGDLHFGPDGYLYISTGDASDPTPPDHFDTGQDVSDLLSSILRIDVDHADPGNAYAVPADNPFVKMPGARPEIWAYGLRNPWRMSFDRATGDLWVGDVGWELWEMVYRIRRGGNYGWSVMEGRQQVRPESKRGPTPILPPTLDFPHTEAASITGGYVYRGTRLKELAGAYLCGDWMTRKVWGTRFDGDRITWHQELAAGTGRVVAFGEDEAGEVYIVFYDEGTVQRLVRNGTPADASAQKFPTRLSETGLFASVKEQTPAAGVSPFSVNAAAWADHAKAQRFVALPGNSSVRFFDHLVPVPDTAFYTARSLFPKDAVLAKTFSMEMEEGNPRSARLLETQILHYDGSDWHGYSYRWNEKQTDAELVPAAGSESILEVVDQHAPGGKRKQTWRYPGRAECIQCHNPWAGSALAFTQPQLDDGATNGDQLRYLSDLGLIALVKQNPSTVAQQPLVDPYHATATLDKRARSYLHVNCSHCHQMGAGGTANIDVRYDMPLAETKTVDVRPSQGAFGIYNGHIISAGDPFRSVLFYRVAKLGPGRMPHIGSEIIDDGGMCLLHDWIRQLTPPHQPTPPVAETTVTRLLANPTNLDTGLLNQALASTDGALRLAYSMCLRPLPETVCKQILQTVAKHSDPQIRDLFERFLTSDQRSPRLGTAVRPEQILAIKGNAARGRELFLQSAGLQCINCHRIGGAGKTLGPDLSAIGKKYGRAQILESILDPSKNVDPAYVTYLLETTDGQIHTGLLIRKAADHVLLKTVDDKEIRIPAKQVQLLVPQKKSLMPELLLRDLTPQQAADLVEFLAEQK